MANMQFRLSHSQQYLVNANPDTNHSANPSNRLMVTVSGNRNPTNPTNPTTKYLLRCDYLLMTRNYNNILHGRFQRD